MGNVMPFACTQQRPDTVPASLTAPSTGLTTVPGVVSIGRRPGRRRRVKNCANVG